MRPWFNSQPTVAATDTVILFLYYLNLKRKNV